MTTFKGVALFYVHRRRNHKETASLRSFMFLTACKARGLQNNQKSKLIHASRYL